MAFSDFLRDHQLSFFIPKDPLKSLHIVHKSSDEVQTEIQIATQELFVNRAYCFYRLYSIGMPLACDVSLSQVPVFVAHQSHKLPGIGLHEGGRAACVGGVSEHPPEKDCH